MFAPIVLPGAGGRKGKRSLCTRRGREFCGHGPQDGRFPCGGREFRAERGPTSLCARRAQTSPPPRGVLHSGPRENAPGASILTVLHEAQKGPWTPSLLGEGGALTQPKSPRPKKKGFTGEHGSPVKSRAARDAVPHCASAEAPRFWWGRPSPAWKAGSIVLRPAAALSRPRPWRKIPAPRAEPLSAGGIASLPCGDPSYRRFGADNPSGG